MNHSYYLHCMGIEWWRLRTVALGVYAYRLGDALRPVGVLLATAELNNQQESQLVTAMVNAMQCPNRGGYFSSYPELPESVRVLILLGKPVAEWCLQRPVEIQQDRGRIIQHQQYQVIVSHAPAQLLNHKALKAEAWQDLQSAMGLFPNFQGGVVV